MTGQDPSATDVARHSYSVLLPVGFTMTAAVASRAVRSYRTVSPLSAFSHHDGEKTGGRYCFCGTVPGVTPAGR